MWTGEVEMKVWMRRAWRLDRFAGAVDVLLAGAGEPADRRILGALGNFVDGGKIPFRGNWKSGLDDIDAHGVEDFGDFKFLFMRHRGAGRLLAVAQGGIEDDDAVPLRLLLGFGRRAFGPLTIGRCGHDYGSLFWRRLLAFWPCEACYGSIGRFVWASVSCPCPECPGVNAQPASGLVSQKPARNEGSTGQGLGPRFGRADIVARKSQVCPRVAQNQAGWSQIAVNFTLTLDGDRPPFSGSLRWGAIAQRATWRGEAESCRQPTRQFGRCSYLFVGFDWAEPARIDSPRSRNECPPLPVTLKGVGFLALRQPARPHDGRSLDRRRQDLGSRKHG